MGDEGQEAIVIDTALGADQILKALRELNAQLLYIVNTHGHPDHITSNAALKKATGAKLMVHELDAYRLASTTSDLFTNIEPSTPDVLLKDGDVIEVGKLSLKVLHTPGHSEGSICLYEHDEAVIFTGDTLFAGSPGRVDLAGGDPKLMKNSLERLSRLPPHTKVLPGHGPSTTIGEESWLRNPSYLDWLLSQ